MDELVPYQKLIYYAAYRGLNSLDVGTNLHKVRSKCKIKDQRELSKCILDKLGTQNSESILNFYDKYKIAIVGHDNEHINYFSNLFEKYPQLIYKYKNGKPTEDRNSELEAIVNRGQNDGYVSGKMYRQGNFLDGTYNGLNAYKEKLCFGISFESDECNNHPAIVSFMDERHGEIIHELSHPVDFHNGKNDRPFSVENFPGWNVLPDGNSFKNVPSKEINCNKQDNRNFIGRSYRDRDSSYFHAAQSVSQYSRESPGEDFAESSVYYFIYPEQLKKIAPEKYKTLQKIYQRY